MTKDWNTYFKKLLDKSGPTITIRECTVTHGTPWCKEKTLQAFTGEFPEPGEAIRRVQLLHQEYYKNIEELFEQISEKESPRLYLAKIIKKIITQENYYADALDEEKWTGFWRKFNDKISELQLNIENQGKQLVTELRKKDYRAELDKLEPALREAVYSECIKGLKYSREGMAYLQAEVEKNNSLVNIILGSSLKISEGFLDILDETADFIILAKKENAFDVIVKILARRAGVEKNTLTATIKHQKTLLDGKTHGILQKRIKQEITLPDRLSKYTTRLFLTVSTINFALSINRLKNAIDSDSHITSSVFFLATDTVALMESLQKISTKAKFSLSGMQSVFGITATSFSAIEYCLKEDYDAAAVRIGQTILKITVFILRSSGKIVKSSIVAILLGLVIDVIAEILLAVFEGDNEIEKKLKESYFGEGYNGSGFGREIIKQAEDLTQYVIINYKMKFEVELEDEKYFMIKLFPPACFLHSKVYLKIAVSEGNATECKYKKFLFESLLHKAGWGDRIEEKTGENEVKITSATSDGKHQILKVKEGNVSEISMLIPTSLSRPGNPFGMYCNVEVEAAIDIKGEGGDTLEGFEKFVDYRKFFTEKIW